MAPEIHTHHSRRLLAAALVLVPAVLASGCSTTSAPSSSPAPKASTSTAAVAVTATQSAASSPTATPSAAAPTPTPAGALSGTWSGSYSGAYAGTFHLVWTQSSAKLTGTINLSTSGTLPLTGTVNGTAITFGTVGSAAVTYTGTVTGDTMSGTYRVGGSQHGTWSAHRTS